MEYLSIGIIILGFVGLILGILYIDLFGGK